MDFFMMAIPLYGFSYIEFTDAVLGRKLPG